MFLNHKRSCKLLKKALTSASVAIMQVIFIYYKTKGHTEYSTTKYNLTLLSGHLCLRPNQHQHT